INPPPSPTPLPTPAPSPTPTPGEKQVSLGEGQREGPLLVQKIYPATITGTGIITGLNFREYPIATNIGTPITLHIGEVASNGCTITLTLTKITETYCQGCGPVAVFAEKTDLNRPCPIC